MEIKVAHAQGFGPDAVLSLSVGSQRRQGPLDDKRLFAFPQCSPAGVKLRAEIFAHVARSHSATVDCDSGPLVVRFPTKPGEPVRTLTLQVARTALLEDEPPSAPRGVVGESGGTGAGPQPPEDTEEVKASRSYLAKAGIDTALQETLHELLRDQPADGLRVLADRLLQISAHRSSLKDVPSPATLRQGVERPEQPSMGWRAVTHSLSTTSLERDWSMEPCFDRRKSMASVGQGSSSLSRVASGLAQDEEDEEVEIVPFTRNRGRGVSAEAFGAWNNKRAAFVPDIVEKTPQQVSAILSAFQMCPLFSTVDESVLRVVINAMPLQGIAPKTRLIKQGADGDSIFVLLAGNVEVYDDAATPPKFICTLPSGRIFGEIAMMYNTPRKCSIYTAEGEPCVVAQLARSVYQNVIVRTQMSARERREDCLRRAQCLETMRPEQIAQLADALEPRTFEQGEEIVTQGDHGDEFFIVLSGTAAALVRTGMEEDEEADVQEHRRYTEGSLFGERALLQRTKRAATVKALTKVEVLSLSRSSFERMLGPLSLLRQEHYFSDPRKMIADFFLPGDTRGPLGVLRDADSGAQPAPVGPRSDFFAVYRPTSRDAIAALIGGEAVGKGLNVKGKSAKRGRFSGRVPFVQISNNEHKEKIMKTDTAARMRIFFMTEADRKQMLDSWEALLNPKEGVAISGDRVIFFVDLYPGVFGLDIPEPIFYHTYLETADLTFQDGYQTGRKSEPAFMDMNLKSLRASAEPKIVILQADRSDPRNPHGLLVAYAESTVKPVVSDFDTFLIGSRNFDYEPLPPDQAEAQMWMLDQVEDILAFPGPSSWTSRWIETIQYAQKDGSLPKVPPLGFGDPVSIQMIKDVMKATRESGAIRHGAECFNYMFPQELDDTYLIVWGGLDHKDWTYIDEDGLREFLLDRIHDGFVFPINPVWAVRDLGWDEVYDQMQASENGKRSMSWWLPESTGIRQKIMQIREDWPEGFRIDRNRNGGSRKSMALDMDANERSALVLDMQAAGESMEATEPEILWASKGSNEDIRSMARVTVVWGGDTIRRF